MNISTPLKITTSVSFVVMVLINALANIMLFNGMNTGQVSDLFPNLFTPAGYTFAIWTLIYVMLLLHVLYLWGVFTRKNDDSILSSATLQRVEILFIVSSIANALWIVAWHFLLLPLSLLLMIVILVCLAWISLLLRNEKLTFSEKILVRLPFSIYFGWITVATIANVTVLLTSFGWGMIPFADIIMIAVLLIGLTIALFTTIMNHDGAYALTVSWAYAGILARYIMTPFYLAAYPAIAVVLSLCLIALIAVALIEFVRSDQRRYAKQNA